MTSWLRGGWYPGWNGIGGRSACGCGPSFACAAARSAAAALGVELWAPVESAAGEAPAASPAGRQNARRPTPTMATSMTISTRGLGPVFDPEPPGVESFEDDVPCWLCDFDDDFRPMMTLFPPMSGLHGVPA